MHPKRKFHLPPVFPLKIDRTLRLLGMSWGVKTTCLEAPGVSLGGSGVSIGGVGSLREQWKMNSLLGRLGLFSGAFGC